MAYLHINFKRSQATAQCKHVSTQEARVIGALDIGGQSASGYAIHGSSPVPGKTRIGERRFPR